MRGSYNRDRREGALLLVYGNGPDMVVVYDVLLCIINRALNPFHNPCPYTNSNVVKTDSKFDVMHKYNN